MVDDVIRAFMQIANLVVVETWIFEEKAWPSVLELHTDNPKLFDNAMRSYLAAYDFNSRTNNGMWWNNPNSPSTFIDIGSFVYYIDKFGCIKPISIFKLEIIFYTYMNFF